MTDAGAFRPAFSVSVRAMVEYALRRGDLTPGMQLSRVREGSLGHRARQAALGDGARTEVGVRGRVEGALCSLDVSGRIDALMRRDGLAVVEEIKLAPAQGAPDAAVPEHRAQAVCYAHLLGEARAVVRVLYVTRAGDAVACFEETLDAPALADEFSALAAPYLARLEARLRWRGVRDASLRTLAFPFPAYREGQRALAAQAYWAVRSRRRLFAQAPTGTGKTAAVLFPALKALGEGLTEQVFYLTARTTARQNAGAAFARMRAQGLRLRTLTLTAKEKTCPLAARDGAPWRCAAPDCPRARGFFDRLEAGLAAMRRQDDWSEEAVRAAADEHALCPFEFSLALCEEADAVVCDYNYAFDPGVRLQRVFLDAPRVTLLVDEAHNLPDRARDMLSATLDSAALRESRRQAGRALGRTSAAYRALTALIREVESAPEGVQEAPSAALAAALEGCMDAFSAAAHAPLPVRETAAAVSVLRRWDARYRTLCAKEGRTARLTLFCLDAAPHLRESTRRLRGCVFFSATLAPLAAWRDALGGEAEDGLLSLPSPFPAENLRVLRYRVSTRYAARARTAGEVARALLALVSARPGNYLACFPSYAYLEEVRRKLEADGPEVVLHVQRARMDDAARAEYLAAFRPRDKGAMLALAVLGGVFGEGVDLPGERLSGVAVVGVGLPQVCPERELLRSYYQQALGDGFGHAYRYPGMNKVLQAVGRLIRTETDRGVALLLDDRFSGADYAALMPPWWGNPEILSTPDGVCERAKAFWQAAGP